MLRPGKGFCGKPKVEDCHACLGTSPKFKDVEITSWRNGFASLLSGADHVYCPSNDCADRISEYFPAVQLSVVPHEILHLPSPVKRIPSGSNKRFAVLGVLNEHKGFYLVKEMLRKIEKNKFPLEIVLIGYSDKPLKSSSLLQTGPYHDADLQELIEKYNPDAILFPARWPETYSYTLSSAMLSGRPVIVPDIGAFPERVKGLPEGFIFPFDLSPDDLVEYLLKLPLRIEKGREELANAEH